MFIFSLALTVISNILYHLFQKVTPGDVNPVFALTVTYLIAAVGTIFLLPFFPLQAGITAEWRKINWASFALGLAVVGLELGYLLAYRVGWELSLASLISNVIVALLLLPIGIFLFDENFSGVNLAGVLVAIIGLVMVNWR